MNYLYQLPGLKRDEDFGAVRHLGYSHDDLLNLDETAFTSTTLGQSLPTYRPAWFILRTVRLRRLSGFGRRKSIATVRRLHKPSKTPSTLAPGLARYDATDGAASIDWNGEPFTLSFFQDINFDGVFSGDFFGFGRGSSLRVSMTGTTFSLTRPAPEERL